MSIIRTCLPFLFYLLMNAALVMVFRRKFGRMLPVSFCITALALYISQYITGSFRPGYLFLAAAAAAALPLCVREIRAGRADELRRMVFSAGFPAFCVIFAGACFLLAGKYFRDWDEYTHWGMMIRESLRMDRFYCVPESRLLWHRDYPPFPCLLETFWCRLAGYSEGNAAIALHVFTMSLLLPALAEAREEKKGGALSGGLRSLWQTAAWTALTGAVVLLLTFGFDLWNQKILFSILPDYTLSFLFAAACGLLWHVSCGTGQGGRPEEKTVGTLVLLETAMVMTKQAGLAFFMLTVLFSLGVCMKRGKGLWGILPQILVPLLFRHSWSRYLRRFISAADTSYQSGQFNLSQISLPDYLQAAAGKGDEVYAGTFRHFLEALAQRKLNTASWLPVTYVTASLFVLLAIVLLHVLFRSYVSRKDAGLLAAVCICGTAGYAFMMSVLYMFCFSGDERSGLAGYSRYMNTYLLAEMLLLLTVLALTVSAPELRRYRGRALAATLGLVLLAGGTPALRSLKPQRGEDTPYRSFEPYAVRLQEFVPDDARVFLICDKDRTAVPQWWDPMQLFVQYFADNLEIVSEFTNVYAADFADPSVTERLETILADCDYLYLIHTREEVSGWMRGCTEDEVLENGIYRVDVREGLRLQLLRQPDQA